MALDSDSAWVRRAIACLAVVGWMLRAYPLVAAQDTWHVPVDYDDGVYFSGASLMWHGALPYRDFAFVHPPGVLLFLAPSAAIARAADPSTGFIASRWTSTLVGAANILLVGHLGLQWSGPVAGLIGAAVYAVHPEASNYERGPYLEPLLNLTALAAAAFWLGRRKRAGWIAAGVCCGLACAIKVWGAFWVAACLFSLPAERPRRAAALYSLGLLGALIVVLAPIAWAAGSEWHRQVIWFHSVRPADGIPRADRAAVMLGRYWSLHLLSAFAALGSLSSRARAISRDARYWGLGLLILLAAFFASPTFWIEYCAHLAAAEAVIAGAGAAVVWNWLARWKRAGRPLAIAACAGLVAPALALTLLINRGRDAEVAELAQFIRRRVSREDCVIAFEPNWLVAAGRLPPLRPRGNALVDSYAAMLLASLEQGIRSGSPTELLHAGPAQERIREILETCPYVALGGRGEAQLSEDSMAWLRERYVRRYPEPGQGGISLWERRH